MGGTLVSPETSDPLRSRLRNVVEEMAIASGVPVPEIYVMEHETGINAFAAGYAPGDAAVAVTRGALEILDRDELQGVIGHFHRGGAFAEHHLLQKIEHTPCITPRKIEQGFSFL